MKFLKVVAVVLSILRGISPELKAALHQIAEEQKVRAAGTINPADDIFWGLMDAILS
jgi:hypothetical protein